jgi:AcrR family transcriptional regulator
LASKKKINSGPRIKKPVQKRSIDTRNKIIDTAKKLFSELGFEETTTNLIASRSGLSIGSIYAHFTDKWEIFHTILDNFSMEVFEYLKARVDKITKDRTSVNEAIEQLILGLYEAHMLNGKLNAEIAKFALMDKTAGQIRLDWEQKMHIEIANLMAHFQGQTKIKNAAISINIVHRSAHEVFQYLYKNRGSINEKAFLNEFVTMIQKYVS